MPPGDTGSREDTWQRPYEQARHLLGVNRHAEAIGILNQALARFPDVVDLRCLLSNAHLGAGNLREAQAAAERAISMAPEREWPHRLRACALLERGSVKKAEASAREALRLAPDEPHCHHVVAVCLLRRRKFKEAEVHAERNRELAPMAPGGHLALAWLSLDTRKWKEAEEHAREALRVAPQSAEAHRALGLALRQLGRGREALDAMHGAAKLRPDTRHLAGLWEQLRTHGSNRAALPLLVALVGPGIIMKTVENLGWEGRPIGTVLDISSGGVFLGGLVWAIVVHRRARKEIPKALEPFLEDRKRHERRESLGGVGFFFGMITALIMGTILLSDEERRTAPGLWIAFLIATGISAWCFRVLWRLRKSKTT